MISTLSESTFPWVWLWVNISNVSFTNQIKFEHHWCECMFQQLTVMGNSCKSTLVLKRKAHISSISYDVSVFRWHSDCFNCLCMLNSWLLLAISHLQICRHNYVIGCNEYLISTLSESTVPWVYSLHFLFKSIHHSWIYERL